MKKGCLILIAVIILCFFGYQHLLAGSELAEMWWIPLLLGISAAMLVGNFQGIIQALRQTLASKRSQVQWREGDLVVISGRLQASKHPQIAPISGKPAAILEYEITKTVRMSDDSSPSTVADYRGCLMVPCAIQSMSGQVSIVGFPLLTHWKSQYFDDQDSYQRIAKFLLTAPTTVMPKSPLAALAELNKVLKDDDGDVQANYRNSNVPNLQDTEQLPSYSDNEEIDEDDEEQEPSNQINNLATTEQPSDRIINFLKASNYSLKETAIENGTEVTAMGTYRAQKRQIDIGSGLSKLAHGIYKGPAAQVLGKNLKKAIILTIVFLVIFLAANYFVLKQIGIDPQHLLQEWQTKIIELTGA